MYICFFKYFFYRHELIFVLTFRSTSNLMAVREIQSLRDMRRWHKTALNHLQIDDAKKEMSNAVKKRINQEIQSLCSTKHCVSICKSIQIYVEFCKPRINI